MLEKGPARRRLAEEEPAPSDTSRDGKGRPQGLQRLEASMQRARKAQEYWETRTHTQLTIQDQRETYWDDLVLEKLLQDKEDIEEQIFQRVLLLQKEADKYHNKVRKAQLAVLSQFDNEENQEESNPEQDGQSDPDQVIPDSEEELEEEEEEESESCVLVSRKKPSKEEELSSKAEDDPVGHLDLRKNYHYDHTHPRHYIVHWTVCNEEYCPYHRDARNERGMAPMQPECGKNRWNECRQDDCEWHLVPKRKYQLFPGHKRQWQICLRERNSECRQTKTCGYPSEKWYYCVHNSCMMIGKENVNPLIVDFFKGAKRSRTGESSTAIDANIVAMIRTHCQSMISLAGCVHTEPSCDRKTVSH